MCDPETRRAIQEDIFGWMRDGEADGQPKKIMWLAGPAGSGKTAIAGSVAETCKEGGLLAATFFFSSFTGSADRHSKRCVVATIALHLAENDALYDYKIQLLASIERNPTIFHKRLVDQAHCLILQPLRAIRERANSAAWPTGIILDGLDEVLVEQDLDPKREQMERTNDDDQLEILEVLHTLAKDPIFPFRIFISSRPERVIDEFFATTAESDTVKLFLDSKYDPDADIRRFLDSKFASIRRRYRISDPSWPGQKAIDRIVEMSSGQFIVPATIVRHIGAGVPQRQLEDIMQLKWEDSGRKNPFAIVDALYKYILHRSPEPSLAAKWIRVYTSSKQSVSALYFKRLVEDVEGEFHHVLGPLSSLVSIPATGDPEAPLKVYHKSLDDFLSSQHRSGDLHLDESAVMAYVAARCVTILKSVPYILLPAQPRSNMFTGNGPSVPVPPGELSQFLDTFYDSTLVNTLSIKGATGYSMVDRNKSPFTLVCRAFDDWLLPLSEDMRAQLALCDVAWWTRLCLADSPCKTKNLGTGFMSAMYCGIHAYIVSVYQSMVCPALDERNSSAAPGTARLP